jgi:hypothetical protein
MISPLGLLKHQLNQLKMQRETTDTPDLHEERIAEYESAITILSDTKQQNATS